MCHFFRFPLMLEICRTKEDCRRQREWACGRVITYCASQQGIIFIECQLETVQHLARDWPWYKKKIRISRKYCGSFTAWTCLAFQRRMGYLQDIMISCSTPFSARKRFYQLSRFSHQGQSHLTQFHYVCRLQITREHLVRKRPDGQTGKRSRPQGN